MFDLSGRLRHRITFEAWAGQSLPVDAWAPVLSDVPAHIMSAGPVQHGTGNSTAKIRFVTRSKSVDGANINMRIVHNGRAHRIVEIEAGREYRGSTLFHVEPLGAGLGTLNGDGLSEIVIQHAPVLGVDSIGQPVQTWSVYATTRAKVEQVRSDEHVKADRVRDPSDTRFTVMYRPITTDMRVVWRGRTYGIVGVVDKDGTQQVVELSCQAL